MKGVALAVICFTTIVIQASLASRLTIMGAQADLVLLLAVAAGIAGGPEVGALIGFGSGFVFDLLLPTPVGMSALCYCLVGYGCGLVQTSVLRSVRWIPVATAAVASAVGTLLLYVLSEVLGQALPPVSHLPIIVIVVAVVNGLLCVPAVWLFRLALAEPSRGSSRGRLPLR